MKAKNNPLVWVAVILIVIVVSYQFGKSKTNDVGQRPSIVETTETPKQPTTDLLMAHTQGLPEQILVRTGYTTSYNSETRCPNWTAWHLTAAHTTGDYTRKGIGFKEDDDVPAPKAQNSDYQRSGYDRGHMCPSGDNKWSKQAQEESFLFTNMCPQSHDLNAGDWNDLEQKCRKWAKQYGDIYIVCGPVFRPSSSKINRRKTIGKNKVAVPTGFYKVVLCMNGTPKAIGFYYDNEDGRRPLATYVRSVDDIEQLTGIDFFAALPDDVENQVEKQADLSAW